MDAVHVNKRCLEFSVIFEGVKGSPGPKSLERCLGATSSLAFPQCLFSGRPLLLHFSKHRRSSSSAFLHHLSPLDEETPYLELQDLYLSYILVLQQNLPGIIGYILKSMNLWHIIFFPQATRPKHGLFCMLRTQQ